MAEAPGPEHAARAFLVERGHDADAVDAAAADGSLPLRVAEELLLPGPGPELTRWDVIVGADVAEDLATALWRALGYPHPADEDVLFVDQDVEALRAAASLIETGVASHHVVEIARVLGSSTSQLAEALADVVSAAAIDRLRAGADADELADGVLRELPVEQFLELHTYALRRQLVATLRRRLDLADGTDGRTVDLAVGFADLAGFTSLANAVDVDELAEVVGRFDASARDVVAASGGRVVKTIGDEIMFVAEETTVAAEIAIGLADIFSADELVPPVRVGMDRGPLMTRGGDYFGPHVNKASRLTAYALPGSVLVSSAIHEALADDDAWTWRSLSRVALKDLGPTRVWVLRAAS